jgi:uncharacterized protein
MNPIDVRDLLDNPGAARTVQVNEPVPGLRLGLAAVPEDAPIRGDLLLESVVEGILVSGPVRGRLALSCARCLKDFEAALAIEVQELFSRDAGPDGEEYPLSPEGSIDIEPMVRDTVLLAVPFSPLCRPDCLGLCERCGGDRNLVECTCAPETADPRWAALDNLF